MGIPWDEDEIGNNCRFFPAGETPKYLWASISGVEWCWPIEGVPLPNGVFMMTQRPTSACTWEYASTAINVIFMLSTNLSRLQAAGGSGGLLFFSGQVTSAPKFSFQNLIICNPDYPPPWACGGSGIVSRRHQGTAPAVANVAELLNIEEKPDSMADFYPAANPAEAVLKFCRQKTPTNILIKVDYSSFES
jgi:hypothetical protein